MTNSCPNPHQTLHGAGDPDCDSFPHPGHVCWQNHSCPGRNRGKFLEDHRRGIDQINFFVRQSRASPHKGAHLRITGDHSRKHAEGDLILAIDLDENRHAPRADHPFVCGVQTFWLIALPDEIAGLQVKRGQKGQQVRAEGWRGAFSSLATSFPAGLRNYGQSDACAGAVPDRRKADEAASSTGRRLSTRS